MRIIGSDYYEGRERSQRILLESLGIQPFLGEEELVGPDGQELDLYHSLFYHDGSAVFTDDFVHRRQGACQEQAGRRRQCRDGCPTACIIPV